jgi:hypothetical protein
MKGGRPLDARKVYEYALQREREGKRFCRHNAGRRALSMLAEWVHGDERLFEQMQDKAFEEYAGMPWGE